MAKNLVKDECQKIHYQSYHLSKTTRQTLQKHLKRSSHKTKK